MLWAQIALLVFIGLGLLIGANQHGKPRKGVESFWLTFSAQLLHFALMLWAGAFSHIFGR